MHLGKKGFAGTRRANKENSLGNLCPNGCVLLGRLEELDNLQRKQESPHR